jgi:hypothetical protein
VIERGDALDEVGQHLGPQQLVTDVRQDCPGPLGRMRRAAPGDVPHALEDDARRDAGPDAVGDGQLALHHEVHDVVREP